MSPQPLQWFRLYAEAIDDEKLRLLAFEDRWHYVALLCCKAMGLLDAGDDDALLHRKLAVKMGLQLRELEAAAQRLAEVGLVDPQTFQPLKWDDRQFKSDTSTDRVRAYRERMKRERNVSETAQETETETETEAEKQKQGSPRGSRLPADWALPADWRAWAQAERPDLDVDREAAKFADYWHGQAGAKARKADWLATWRNWVRNSHARAGPRAAQQVGKTMQGLMALEGLKRGNRVAAGPNRGGDAEAVLPRLGKDPSR